MVFNLSDIVVLLIVIVVGIQFWRIRAIAEAAKRYLSQYCEKQGLQLISVARSKTRLGMYRGKPDWHTQFHFEFSGNGEDSYLGTLSMAGLTVTATDMPAYRIN